MDVKFRYLIKGMDWVWGNTPECSFKVSIENLLFLTVLIYCAKKYY